MAEDMIKDTAPEEEEGSIIVLEDDLGNEVAYVTTTGFVLSH